MEWYKEGYDEEVFYHPQMNEKNAFNNNLKINIMTKAKISRIESTKDHVNSFGTTIYHSLEMDNGDKINIGKKKLQVVGWELIYEIVDEGQEYNKAKAVSKKDYDEANPNATPQPAAQSTQPANNNVPDVGDAILYQSTMKEVMGYFLTHGFDSVEDPGADVSVKSRMDLVSDTCIYLAKKSKANILKLK